MAGDTVYCAAAHLRLTSSATKPMQAPAYWQLGNDGSPGASMRGRLPGRRRACSSAGAASGAPAVGCVPTGPGPAQHPPHTWSLPGMPSFTVSVPRRKPPTSCWQEHLTISEGSHKHPHGRFHVPCSGTRLASDCAPGVVSMRARGAPADALTSGVILARQLKEPKVTKPLPRAGNELMGGRRWGGV